MKLFDGLKRAAAAAAACMLGIGCCTVPAAAADAPMTFRLTVDNDLFTVQELAESEQVVHGAMYIENYTGISSMRIVIANSEGIIIENGGFADPCFLEGREESRNVYNPYSQVHDVSNLIAWYGPYADDGVSWDDTPVADENAAFVTFDVRIPKGTPAGQYQIYFDTRDLVLSSGKLYPLFNVHSFNGDYDDIELPAVVREDCTITVVDDSVAPGTGNLGDVDSDGDVDTTDAMSVLQFYNACHVMGNGNESEYKERLDPALPEVAYNVSDINGDGSRNTVDALWIILYYNRVTLLGEDISWEQLLAE